MASGKCERKIRAQQGRYPVVPLFFWVLTLLWPYFLRTYFLRTYFLRTYFLRTYFLRPYTSILRTYFLRTFAVHLPRYYFSLRSPCCSLIFLRTYGVPCCALIYLRT